MTGMADEVEAAHEDGEPSNGAPKLSREEFAARERAAFLAGNFDDDEDEAPKNEPKRTAPVAELDEDSDDDLDEDDDAEPELAAVADDDDLDDEEDEEDDEIEAPAKEADADLAKRIAKIRQTEQRSREQIARERRDAELSLDRREAELKPRLDKLDRFERLESRAGTDPLAALRALGVTDMEYVARQAYAEHLAATDPKHKDAAVRMQRERDVGGKLETLEKELADFKAKEAAREAAAADADRAAKWFGGIAKVAAKIEAPLTQKFVAANPERAKAELAQISLDLWNKTGEEPSAARVVQRFEKIKARELRALGFDPVVGKAPAGKVATTKTGAVTAAKPNGKIVVEERKLTDRELREQIVAEMKSGSLD